MRRLFVIPLVGVMPAVLAVPVLAEEGSGKLTFPTDETGIEIQGKYDAESSASKVFSVDIKWGNMKAIYAPYRREVWDPVSLKTITVDGGTNPWTWAQTKSSNNLEANEISITNYSNVPITCDFAFNIASNLSGITATVTSTDLQNKVETNSFGIKSAAATTSTELADRVKELTRSGFVTLEGKLPESQTTFSPIGTIAVTLKETGVE